MRGHDIEVFSHHSGLSTSQEEGKKKQKKTKKTKKTRVKAPQVVVEEPFEADGDQVLEKQVVNAKDVNFRSIDVLSSVPSVLEYDETLLAIVGILDKFKNQSHAASWIRTGGLLPGKPSNADALPSENPLWFEDADVAKDWAESGKKVLAALDIELISGVTAPSQR